MARTREPIAFLDTHVAAWLYAGLVEKLSEPARAAIEGRRVCLPPIARLELQYLHEIGRLTDPAERVVEALQDEIGLVVPELSLNRITVAAIGIDWTRDVFDRLIVACVQVTPGACLVTKDRLIRKHYAEAVW